MSSVVEAQLGGRNSRSANDAIVVEMPRMLQAISTTVH